MIINGISEVFVIGNIAIPAEFVREWVEMIDGNKLPAIRTFPDGWPRKRAKHLIDFLIERGFAMPPRGNNPAVVKDAVMVKTFLLAQRFEREEFTTDEFNHKDGIGYIYFICGSNGLIKIGKADNLSERMATLSYMSPVPIELLYSIEVPIEKVYETESFFHRMFAAKRHHGEWFKLKKADLEHIGAWDERSKGNNVAFYMPYYWRIANSKVLLKKVFVLCLVILYHWAIYAVVMSMLPRAPAGN